MRCELIHEGEGSRLFRVTDEFDPRFDKRNKRWSCGCDDWVLDGGFYPCKHIERAKEQMEVICRRKMKS